MVVALMSLFGGCGDPTPEPTEPLCVVVPDVLAGGLGEQCAHDDDCPCGAWCERSVCASECSEDTPCPGTAECDLGSGRCQETGAALVRGPRNQVLRTSSSEVIVRPSGRLTVSAEGDEPVAFRVRATPGFEVNCGGDFDEQCDANASASAPAILELRASEAAPDGCAPLTATPCPSGTLTLTSDFDRLDVALVVSPGAAAPAPLTGTYEATLTAVGAGLSTRPSTDDLLEGARGIRVQATIEVFADDTIRLRDELGVFGDGAVGTLTAGGAGEVVLSIPRFAWLTGTRGDSLDPQIVTSFDDALLAHADGAITGELFQRFHGMTDAAETATLRWALAAGRLEQQPELGTPPAVPAPAELPPADRPVAEDESAPAGSALELACASGALSDSELDAEGDLRCSDGATQAVLPRFGDTVDPVDGSALLASCYGDLEGAGSECVDRELAVAALVRALDGPAASAERALGLRLLQRWITLHGFIAREGLAIERLHAWFADGDPPPIADPDGPGPREWVEPALARSLDGWDLLFHPRVGSALVASEEGSLASPDYRTRFGYEPPVATELADADLGISVTLLDVLRDQLRAAEVVVRRRMGADGLTEAMALGRAALRRAVVALAWAHGLLHDATAGSDPVWAEQADAAAQGVGSAMRSLLAAIRAAESGANALGIEDIDLPLYRIGDEVGSAERFAAASDYLLGAGGVPGVAPSLVEAARTAWDDVRSSWRDKLTRDFRTFSVENRVEDLQREYGAQIAELCGNPAWAELGVLELSADELNPNHCYIVDRDGCPTPDRLEALITPTDVAQDVCVMLALNRSFRPLDVDDMEIGEALDRLNTTLENDRRSRSPDRALLTFLHRTRRELPQLLEDYRDQFPVPGPLAYENARTRCGALVHELGGEMSADEEGRACTSARECHPAMLCRMGSCTAVEPPAPDATCYQGTLGELRLALQASAREVDIARSEFADRSDAYDIAVRSCLIQQTGGEDLLSALSEHTDTMVGMRQAKGAADGIAAIAAATADASDSTDAFFSGGVAPAARLVQGAAELASTIIDSEMDVAQLRFEEMSARLEASIENATCFNDARAEMVGMRTAQLRIEQAGIENARQALEFANAQATVLALVGDGQAVVQSTRDRAPSGLRVDFAFDTEVAELEARMHLARRAAYLAVRAVEYEFQTTSAERGRVLAARTPAALESALGRLTAFTATGAPTGGGQPQTLHAVVSLRDHLLQLGDRTGGAPGWRNLSPAQRFAMVLGSDRYAVYEAGDYIGQEIPFTISPDGAANPEGITILTGTDCAERVWSVNASVLGEDLVPGSETTFTRVVIRKRNTFHSQWCADPGSEGPAYQFGSVRPERNLFLDPLVHSMVETDVISVGPNTAAMDPARSFTNARISAFFNISRAELEDESYFNGDSTELAGRGLYGDYALFIPAESPLALGNVDDLLLRIDYVSAATM